MKLLITIPVYISNELHAEFTEITLKSIKTVHDYEIYLIKNYCKPEFEFQLKQLQLDQLCGIITNPKGNSVPASWNLGIQTGIDKHADFIIIPNNDLIFRHDCIDNLIKFAKQHDEFVVWTATEYTDKRTLEIFEPEEGFDNHPHFSCFMLSPKTIELLKEKEVGTKEPYPGLFDENFKMAYFEDGDYHQRILRAGYKGGRIFSALFYHFGSRTIKVDDDVDRMHIQPFEANAKYFESKWGWNPNGIVTESNDPIRFKYKGPFTP